MPRSADVLPNPKGARYNDDIYSTQGVIQRMSERLMTEKLPLHLSPYFLLFDEVVKICSGHSQHLFVFVCKLLLFYHQSDSYAESEFNSQLFSQ